MTPSRAAASTAGIAQQRRIALVSSSGGALPGERDERAQHAMRLFDTMLWVLKGTTREAWSTAAPEDADIVVVQRGPGAADWRSRGKLVVELATEGENAGDSEHVLTYPFPAQRVLELLEKLSARLDPSQPAPAIRASASAVNTDRWNLPEALRTLREVRNDAQWLVARDGADPVLWLRGDGSSYFATESFVQSLREDMTLSARLQLRAGYPPPKTRVVERPGADLFWHAGFNASDSLAPWLDKRQVYRITRWPDFGVIRPAPAVLRCVALLAAEPMTLATLVQRARVSTAFASRVCNALALCEVLVEVQKFTARAAAGRMQAPAGGFADFLRRIRSHLGLEAAP